MERKRKKRRVTSSSDWRASCNRLYRECIRKFARGNERKESERDGEKKSLCNFRRLEFRAEIVKIEEPAAESLNQWTNAVLDHFLRKSQEKKEEVGRFFGGFFFFLLFGPRIVQGSAESTAFSKLYYFLVSFIVLEIFGRLPWILAHENSSQVSLFYGRF